MAKSKARILSLDGGGIRGLIFGELLARIERETGRPLSETFHLIGGTSTGGLYALALAAQFDEDGALFTAERINEIYEEMGPKIFDRSFLKRITSLDGWIDELYDARSFERALKAMFGDKKISEAPAHFLATGYDIERGSALFFKSWQGATDPNHDFLMRDAARATTAAPTYFEPALIHSLDDSKSEKERRRVVIDGGAVATNPASSVLAEARRIYPKAAGIEVLSAGTGRIPVHIPFERAKNRGKLHWLPDVHEILMDGNSQAVEYQMEMEKRAGAIAYYRASLALPECVRLPNGKDSKIDLDNATPGHIAIIKQMGQELADRAFADPNFQALLAEWKKAPKAPVEELGFDPVQAMKPVMPERKPSILRRVLTGLGLSRSALHDPDSVSPQAQARAEKRHYAPRL